MQVLIQEDFSGIEMWRCRQDLIQQLDYVLGQLDRGLDHLKQYKPGLDIDHVLLAKMQYSELKRVLVMFGFRRNPNVARNGRSEGRKCIQLIAIDYRTVAGTAGAEYKGDQRSKGPDSRSPFWTPTALWRHKGEEA